MYNNSYYFYENRNYYLMCNKINSSYLLNNRKEGIDILKKIILKYKKIQINNESIFELIEEIIFLSDITHVIIDNTSKTINLPKTVNNLVVEYNCNSTINYENLHKLDNLIVRNNIIVKNLPKVNYLEVDIYSNTTLINYINAKGIKNIRYMKLIIHMFIEQILKSNTLDYIEQLLRKLKNIEKIKIYIYRNCLFEITKIGEATSFIRKILMRRLRVEKYRDILYLFPYWPFGTICGTN